MLLTSAQLLPSLELQQLTPRRPGGLSAEQTFAFGIPPAWTYFWGALDATPGAPRSTYLGVAALLLMPLSLLQRRRRTRALCLWMVAGFAALVVLTMRTPLFEMLRLLPASSWFRLPQRILCVYAFAASILTGLGLQVVARAARKQDGARADARRWVPPLLATLIAVVCIALVRMPILSLVYLSITVALLWASAFVPSVAAGRAVVAALVALLAWDLGYAGSNRFLRPAHAPGVFEAAKPIYDFIARGAGMYRTYVHRIGRYAWVAPKQGTLRRLPTVLDYEPLSLARHGRFAAMLEEPRRARADRPFAGEFMTGPRSPHFDRLNLMSVGYVVAAEADEGYRRALVDLGWQLAPVRTAVGAMVYVNPDPLPRAYVAFDWVPARDEEEALQAVRARDFDYRRTVVLEVEDPLPQLEDVPERLQRAYIREYGAHRVTIDVETPAPGHLVLTDSFYPGWTARVDGRPRRILRANYLFRAVPIEAGEHVVTFTYEPWTFRLGVLVSLLAAAILVVGVCKDRRQRICRATRARTTDVGVDAAQG